MRIFFQIVFFTLCLNAVFGQELPLNSQVFINPYYYNPAYAGFEDRPAFYVYRRQQWTGIEGAPLTTGFNFHTIFKEKINFGVLVYNDKRSILNTTHGLVTFGYRASFDEFQYISFGLSGGFGFNTIDLDAIDPNDPAIAEALDNNIFLDGNAGINYYNRGFNLGISLPKIFKTKTISNSSFTTGEISPLDDVILMTNYKWQISEDKFAFEPFLTYYYNKDLPGQFEVTALVHLMNVIWIGASYKQDYGSTALVGINVKDNFKFGYAYEFFNTSPATFNNGTHDIQLAIIIGEKKKKGKVNLIQQRRNMLRSMGQLPSEQNQNVYQVEKDPFVPPPVETYNEDEALQELLDEMEEEQNAPEEVIPIEEFDTPVEEDTLDIYNIQFDDEVVSEPEVAPVVVLEELETPVEDDTLDIYDIQFDDEIVSEPEVAPEIIATVIPEPEEIDEEEELIRQMEEEAMEEITFEEEEELTSAEPELDQISDGLTEEPEIEFVEPTLDDEGFYIGPTTVIKGDHLLELEKGNYVVVGTFGSYRDAEEHSDQLFIQGFYTKFGYISQTKIYYVYIFESDDLDEANDTSERFKEIGAKFRENWVLQVQ